MTTTNKFPISMFRSVTENKTSESIYLNFSEFVNAMKSFSDESFASKKDAPLFSSTIFENGLRRKSNATVSGLIVLDIDDGVRTNQAFQISLQLGIKSLIYTTASHRHEHHKFRLCIPLAENVDYETHVKCWHAINMIFTGQNADKSKVGCESMFYVPGRYPNAPKELHTLPGNILSAEEWIDLVELPTNDPSRPRATIKPQTTKIVQPKHTGGSLKFASDSDLNIFESKLVTEAALNKYLESNGGWHQARFGLMTSIAMRAVHIGVQVSSTDIAYLFNQIDLMDGGHYQTSKYQIEIQNDAAKALAQIV